MAVIRPFKAIRPDKEAALDVAALPYDVYSEKEARAEVSGKPLSFLNIDRSETQFPEGTDPYAPEVYEKASELLQNMIKDGTFVIEEKACYYLYELTFMGRTQTGIVCCASIDD
ncbi:MAG: DUF1015 family protein, partial [Lachnospiraceae bacterium]|nr:DUF1015 family protein [Lachnospiraceae bacterium]